SDPDNWWWNGPFHIVAWLRRLLPERKRSTAQRSCWCACSSRASRSGSVSSRRSRGCRSRPRPGCSARSSATDCSSAPTASGYATILDELELGLAAMAAPVRDTRGRVVAALSISAPANRLTNERIERLAPLLLEQADWLGRQLSHHHHERGAA